METISEYTKDNKKLIIVADTDCENPRTAFDNLGTMVCFHRRYTLGDTHSFSIEEAKEIQHNKDNIVLPLYLYDHSGLRISTNDFNDSWDSGCVGFIYISKAKVRSEYGWKVITKERINKIETYLKNEVNTYDSYLSGECYGYKLFEDDNEIDSCYGFYGSDFTKNGLFETANWK